MRRFFAETLDTGSDKVVLTGDEAHHIRCVLRMKAGDEVLLINGRGEECVSCISSLSETGVELEITDRRPCFADPSVEITLFQCLPKQGKMEVIIQKCVELGVSHIVPTISKRCVVKLDGKENKLVRWNKVAVEAAKQCGRARVPKVETPIELSHIDIAPFDTVIFAYENESDLTLKSVLHDGKVHRSIAVIIGPEGGFDNAEAEELVKKGASSVSLGRRILRTETAGMATIAQIMYELEQ